MKISAHTLRKMDACAEGIKKFREVFQGRAVEWTENNLLYAVLRGDMGEEIDWLLRTLDPIYRNPVISVNQVAYNATLKSLPRLVVFRHDWERCHFFNCTIAAEAFPMLNVFEGCHFTGCNFSQDMENRFFAACHFKACNGIKCTTCKEYYTLVDGRTNWDGELSSKCLYCRVKEEAIEQKNSAGSASLGGERI